PAAVLIRSCEPLTNLPLIKKRRGNLAHKMLTTGPGCVGQALAINRELCHHPLFEKGGFEVYDGQPINTLLAGPRVGIDYACEKDRLAHFRFADGDSLYVSKKSLLLKFPDSL